MKKTIIFTALACAAVLSARDIDDRLDNAKLGAPMIPNWKINAPNNAANYGKGKIIVGSESDEKALQLTASTERSTSIYMTVPTAVKVGEFLEFSAEVKGKGTVTVSYYAYNSKNGYLPVAQVPYKSFPLTNDWKEIKCKLEIKPSKSGQVSLIRPCITISKGGELVIEDIDLEIDND